ncbi:hypothetical protein AAE026_21975 [Bradyrhizobium sp. DN5]|uniref:hypothetical protein n=1 Tax=Bradyrhizobium sp. DN5 TaxID=3056950 RepID=UPI0035251425
MENVMARNEFQNTAGFPTASSASPYGGVVAGPLQAMMAMRTGDPMEVLPNEAREKFRELEQKRGDAGILVRAIVEDQQQLRIDIQRHQNRIKELQTPRGTGGFDLGDDAPQVISERRTLEEKLAEQRRLTALNEARSTVYQRIGELVRNVEQAVAARPAGCIGQMVKIDLRAFKGSILDAIEARRQRCRELKADLHRVRSAPWPSDFVKQKMREQINRVAESGRPLVEQAVEHNEQVSFPSQSHQVRIFNSDPAAIGYVELPNTLEVVFWLHRDELIASMERAVDEIADDQSALTEEQRRDAEAEIHVDLLAVEREECALVEIAQSQGLPADYRVDCDVRAILGFEWVPAPARVPREDDGQFGVVRRVGP